jgi:hypothetical protein
VSEDVYPHSRLPLLPPEVVRARLEDPHFAEVLGRVRAKIRRQEYQPELHYPHRPGAGLPGASSENEDRLVDLMDKWRERGNQWSRTVENRRHLRAV